MLNHIAVFTLIVELFFVVHAGVLEERCKDIYEDLEAKGVINFTGNIRGFVCDGEKRYHCLHDKQNNKNVENCYGWTLIEPGKCPIAVSHYSGIHVANCVPTKDTGCPKTAYISYEYYRFSDCMYDKTDIVNQKQKENTASSVRIVIPIVVVAILVGLAIIAVVVWYRRRPSTGSSQPIDRDMSVVRDSLLGDGNCEILNDAFGKLKYYTQIELNKSKNEIYVPIPRIVRVGMDKLNRCRTLVITGEKGAGVTSLARYLMAEFANQYTPIDIGKHLSNFDAVLSGDTPCIVYLRAIELADEERIPEGFFSCKQHLLIYEMSKNRNTGHIGQHEAFTLDLSSREYTLNTDDKLSLINGYCDRYPAVKLSDEERKECAKTSPKKGFPKHCWNFFNGEYKKHPAVEYFKS